MFTDWTWNVTNPDAVAHLFIGPPRLGPVDDVVRDLPLLGAPLRGTGSLQLQMLGSDRRAQGYYTAAHGFSAGLVRTLVSPALPDAGVGYFGLYCLASQLDLTGGSGTVYGVICDNYLYQHRAYLVRGTLGGDWWSFAGLASSDVGHWSTESSFTMQLLWRSVPGTLLLEYWRGAADDYSDLALVLQVSQATTLGYASVAEGLWAGAITASEMKIYYDNTWIYAGAP
jgi:hypothetical protein